MITADYHSNQEALKDQITQTPLRKEDGRLLQ